MCKGRRWGGDGQRVHGASRDGRLHAYHLDTSILNSLASATYTAARRGHRVILCEKEPETGGILRSEQTLRRLLGTPCGAGHLRHETDTPFSELKVVKENESGY